MRPSLRERIFDYTHLAFWVGLIVTMYVLVALINLSAKNTALRDQADSVEEDTIRLESEISGLQAQVAYFGTAQFKEKQVREKLGLQAPGENVVIVGRGDADRGVKGGDTSASSVDLPDQTHVEEWATFLFGGDKG